MSEHARHSQNPLPGQSWDLFQDQLQDSVLPVDDSPAEDLPDDYYLLNFIYLITFVEQRYASLLNRQELDLLDTFHQLTPDAQKLYVRLWMRKGPLFRSDKLRYAEISSIHHAVLDLRRAGLLIGATDAALEDLLKLLTREEMIALLRPRAGIGSLKRPELETVLTSSLEEGDLQAALPFEIYEPQGYEALKTFRLLFFGNLYQDMSEFVLRDLGLTPFEDYQIDQSNQTFSERGVVDEALYLHQLSELSDAVIAEKDPLLLSEFTRGVPARHDDVASLGRRHDRLINRLAREMERQDLADTALHYYHRSLSTPARERTARILARPDGDKEAAISMCEQILAEPWEESEYEFAAKFMKRQLSADDPRLAQLPDLSLAVSSVELALHKQPDVRVEQLVCEWAEADGATARYVENALFPGLFGLAFWDVIFSDLPGVFFNPFQRGPADLFHQDFHQLRADAIEERFIQLARPDQLKHIVLQHHGEKAGLSNHFVSWAILTRELVDLALAAISVDHLLSIFRRMLVDLRDNRSGFPDLIVFRDSGYQLIEVKGPGDRLQLNQQRWFRFFERCQIPAVVANVTFADAPAVHERVGMPN
jgi:hypothetical protein